MLNQQNPGIHRAWDWLNGRRTLGEVWERLQYGGKTPFGALCALIALLQEEGLVEEAHPIVFQVEG